VRPAAGPLTLTAEPENMEMMRPPTTPAMIPLNNGAPDASAMPRQRGRATRKTTSPAGASYFFKLEKSGFRVWVEDMGETISWDQTGDTLGALMVKTIRFLDERDPRALRPMEG
jgi:hypothetical protein